VSVRPSASNSATPTGRIICETSYFGGFTKIRGQNAILGKDGQNEQTLCTKTYGHFARRHTHTGILRRDIRTLCAETYGHVARRPTGILRGDVYVIGLYNWDRICFLTVAKWGWNNSVSGIEHASRALAEAFSRLQVPAEAPFSIPGAVHARFIVHRVAVGQDRYCAQNISGTGQVLCTKCQWDRTGIVHRVSVGQDRYCAQSNSGTGQVLCT
jgi:hypothetical protein